MTGRATRCWRGRWRREADTGPSIIPIAPGTPISRPDIPFSSPWYGVSRGPGPAAHLASCLCAVGATLAAWWWFRRIYPRDVALVIGLALAVNWAWSRAGTGIQSEPLYELLGQVTILVVCRWAGRGGVLTPIFLGVLLAACLLTRQIAIGLALAVVVDLAMSRRGRAALVVGATAAVLVAPWLAWLVVVGAGERTQASLLIEATSGFLTRLASQFVFYLQRIPDHITGPLVEIATRIRPSAGAAAWANLWALAASALVFWGWVIALYRPRRRLAGLIPLLTLGLLLAWPYTEAGRFLVPLIPCLLIGAVEGTSGLIRGIKRTSRSEALQAGEFASSRRCCSWSRHSPTPAIPWPRAARGAGDAANRDFDMACAGLPGMAIGRVRS